jgi:serine/threonine-protein kinase
VIGQRIGSYTIVEKLGEGGMGVVYRATDSRLHRDVALKFIPQALAKDPQTMGRFEREAQVLASLNHPNIASIYGFEETGEQRALVMELAPGEELAARIQRGKIPLEETLRIALAIAEALEAAHDRGIIHRDLKPANIKLGDAGDSGGGRVKILDFGLAKALQGDVGSSSGIDLTRSPTLSVAATQAGMILGTASYMSPEQARALPADRRADIWSFGAILYEMLAGRRAFVGETVADTMAKVLEHEPDWSLLPANTPPAIKNLLERCLVKSPRQRLQAIGDARLVIEETLAEIHRPARPLSVDTPPPTPATEPAPGSRTRPWFAIVPWILAGALGLALAGALLRRPAVTPEDPLVMEIVVGTDDLYNEVGSGFALSPDGKRLAFVEARGSERRLFVRALNELEPLPLALDEVVSNGPYHPFVSPDGSWIGYALPNELRKVQVSGGAPLTICKAARSRGATWLADDTIVFTPNPSSGLFRVPAVGGEPQPLTTLDEQQGELTHRWPQALPDGKHVLFTTNNSQANYDSASLEVVDVHSGERKVVYRGGTYGRYVPTGHLTFVNHGTLFAIPFDLDSLETSGSPVPVIQQLVTSVGEGGAQYDFSQTGRLVYGAQGPQALLYPISWVDRDGRPSPLLEEPGLYANPRLSPDGTRLALTVLRDDNWDVWVYDLQRNVSTRLTFDEGVESEQIWSPDGVNLVFSSDRDGPDSLYRKRADGSGESERLTEAKFAQWADSISNDGRYVVYIENQAQFDINYLDLETKETHSFLKSQFSEGYPGISPNGRFVAYTSNESGTQQIYVRPFPTGEGKWQVSDATGTTPRWRADGRELFWRNDDGIVAVDVETDGPTFRAGKPKQLLSGRWKGGLNGVGASGLAFADFDVSPDGKRFVMFPDVGGETQSDHQHLTLVTRWFDQLRSVAAPGSK